jgi:RHS repeat-associated protein
LRGAIGSPQKEYDHRNGQLLITTAALPAGWGAPPAFTPPATLVTGLDIKLEHLTELRTAVNDLRAHAGLSPYSFTVDPNPERNVTSIKADHIRQLRTALEQARSQLGLSTSYAHPTLTENSSWIYATDFQELSDQILSAWNSGTGGVDINWLVADQLGTPRMIFDKSGSLTVTNQNGNYVSGMTRHDYLPFGEELVAGQGGRITAQGYAADTIRQKFTQKERDNETGLDYFGARYYASTQGRFTSADALLSSGIPGEPQSWNRYSYTINNPLKYLDPTGLIWVYLDSGKTRTFRWYDDPNDVPQGWTEYTAPYYDGADGRYYLNPKGPAGWFDAGSNQGNGGQGLFTINTDPYVRNGWAKGPTPEQYAAYMRSGAVEDASWDIVMLLLPGKISKEGIEAGLTAKAAKEALEAIPSAANPRLQRAIDALFQSTDKMPGGTAGAIRHELSTGELVGGSSHLMKGEERIRSLQRIMREEKLNPKDRGTAQRLMHDLQSAMKGK